MKWVVKNEIMDIDLSLILKIGIQKEKELKGFRSKFIKKSIFDMILILVEKFVIYKLCVVEKGVLLEDYVFWWKEKKQDKQVIKD